MEKFVRLAYTRVAPFSSFHKTLQTLRDKSVKTPSTCTIVKNRGQCKQRPRLALVFLALDGGRGVK